MKFFGKKDKQPKQAEAEYVEPDDQDDYVEAQASTSNRPKTSQSRAESSYQSRNMMRNVKSKEEEYDDEKDFDEGDDDLDYEDEEEDFEEDDDNFEVLIIFVTNIT